MMPFSAFADGIVCPACGGTVTKQERRLVSAHDDFYKCDTCGKWAWVNKLGSLSLFSVGDQQILDAADASALINFSFNNGHLIPAKQVPSGIGRKDLPGYADDNGTPNYTSSGFLTMMVEPYALGVKSSKGCVFTKSETDPVIYSLGASGEGTQYPNGYWYGAIYKFTAPVSGIYFIGSDIGNYEFGSLSLFYTNWSKYSMSYTATNKYQCSIVLNAGEDCYFIYSVYVSNASYKGKPYRYQLNPIPISIEPIGNTTIKKQTNITINNNTWNGNIYTDNSTNLTYIYPQYTTINEKNETVTNISENPIIYNNETKQYYTYDSVTQNYYYITYNENPTTPTPSPSPTPDPDNPSVTPSPAPEPGGGSSGGDGGSGSGGSSGGSGSSWWDKLLDKLGSALIDGLLGAISAVLKLIFKLLSTILGWIIWLVSQVLTLFPFLPPGLGALLIGGVVVCFVIGIIKFIRG